MRIIAWRDRKGKEKMSKRQWRDLIIRAIEDGIILFMLGAGIWATCWLLGGLLKAAGVD